MTNVFWLITGIFGFVGVGLGAFGAHALKNALSSDALAVYQVGVQYHMLHTLALGLVAVLTDRSPASPAVVASGWCFTAGILVFSGSLYALALSGIRVLGAVTPLGGLAFLAGWATLGCAAWQGR